MRIPLDVYYYRSLARGVYDNHGFHWGVLAIVIASLAIEIGIARSFRQYCSPSEAADAVSNWRAPAELLGQIPRRVRATWARLAKTLLGTVFAAAVGYFGSWSLVFRMSSIDASTRAKIDEIVSILLAFIIYRWMNLPRVLLKWGTAAPAVVCTKDKLDGYDDLVYFQFQRADGGSTRTWMKMDCAPIVGDVFTILYDPRRPTRTCAYPVDEFEVVSREPLAAGAEATQS